MQSSSSGRRRPAALLCRLLLATAAFVCFAAASPAQDDDLDALLGGFDDDTPTVTDESGQNETLDDLPEVDDPFWELTGDASLGSSYNYRQHRSTSGTSYGNVSRLRAQLDLQLDLDLPAGWEGRISGFTFYDFAYLIHGRSQYTGQVLDNYEWEVDAREVWVQGSPINSLDLKLGRQVVNWGRSDSLRVIDIINPLDNREPGLVDIEDLRRPVAMARVDYYPSFLPAWNVQLLLIPEFRRDKNPPFGSDFNPTPRQFRGANDNSGPSHWGDPPEFGAALSGTFSGWDVSLYGARVYENTRFVQGGVKSESQITMVGAGGNVTFGSWLLKSEIAYFYGVEYGTVTPILVPPGAPGAPPTVSPYFGTTDKNRLDVMGGVEYYGINLDQFAINDTQIAFEVANRHIFDFESRMSAFRSDDEIETALRVTLDVFNSRLHLTALGFVLGERAQNGSVVRIEASYDLIDALVLGGGIVLYQEGNNPGFDQIGRNDRFFLRIEYSF